MSFSLPDTGGSATGSQPPTPDLRVVIGDEQRLGLGGGRYWSIWITRRAKAAFLHNFVTTVQF